MIIDSSALLALLWNETGAQIVEQNLDDLQMSSVNIAEVYCKLKDRNIDISEAASLIAQIGIDIIDFDNNQAQICSQIRPMAKPLGLSLGDLACISLAIAQKAKALTADRAWLGLNLPIEIISIR